MIQCRCNKGVIQMSERDERNLQEIFQHPMTSNTSAVTTSNMKAPGECTVTTTLQLYRVI